MRKKTKVKGGRSASSQSSDDGDQVKTLGIINSMSQKYVGKHKRRQSPRLRSTLHRQTKQDVDIYEGDVENNADSSSSQEHSPSAEVYDFVPAEDEVRLKLDLSPDNKKKATKAKTAKSESVPTKRTSKRKIANKSSDNETIAKTCKMIPAEYKPPSQRATQAKSALRKSVNADSGIFMTPPSILGMNSSVDNSTPAPTSTPSLNTKQPQSKRVPPSGFPRLSSLSPVEHVGSLYSYGYMGSSENSLFMEDDMDHSSPRIATDASNVPKEKTYSGVLSAKKQLRSPPVLDAPANKKAKITKKQKFAATITKAQEVADKMNKEFEEIENFSLSIDDF